MRFRDDPINFIIVAVCMLFGMFLICVMVSVFNRIPNQAESTKATETLCIVQFENDKQIVIIAPDCGDANKEVWTYVNKNDCTIQSISRSQCSETIVINKKVK